MNFETIITDTRSGVGYLIFNRPNKLNAINEKCLDESYQAIKEFDNSKEVRVIVIKGSGERAFSAGADISELADASSEFIEPYNRKWLKFFNAVESSPKPVIASVNGWATGGGTELTVCCDFVICSNDSRFGLTEINIGVFPGAGAAVRLTRHMGRLKAKEILMLGEFISSKKAVELGLANFSVSNEDLDNETKKLSESLAKKAPLALAAIKRTINEGSEGDINMGLEYELAEFIKLFSTEDQKEGMKAFLEKRQPNFKGV